MQVVKHMPKNIISAKQMEDTPMPILTDGAKLMQK